MLSTEQEQVSYHEPLVIGNVELYQGLSPEESVSYVYTLLTQQLDNKTAMFISHGKHVIDLFHKISQYETLEPYSVLMSEEVLGDPFHLESIEFAYQQSGLMDVLSKRGIPFFRILSRAPSFEGTLRIYSSRVAEILNRCMNSHIFMEIKDDGSVGGLRAIESETECAFREASDHERHYVVGYTVNGRSESDCIISLSLMSLRRMKTLWVFAFGESPGKHVQHMINANESCSHKVPATHLRTMPGRVRVFTDMQVV